MKIASVLQGILNSIFVQPVFGDERAVFYRERGAGMYAVEPWYIGLVGFFAHLDNILAWYFKAYLILICSSGNLTDLLSSSNQFKASPHWIVC